MTNNSKNSHVSLIKINKYTRVMHHVLKTTNNYLQFGIVILCAGQEKNYFYFC